MHLAGQAQPNSSAPSTGLSRPPPREIPLGRIASTHPKPRPRQRVRPWLPCCLAGPRLPLGLPPRGTCLVSVMAASVLLASGCLSKWPEAHPGLRCSQPLAQPGEAWGARSHRQLGSGHPTIRPGTREPATLSEAGLSCFRSAEVGLHPTPLRNRSLPRGQVSARHLPRPPAAWKGCWCLRAAAPASSCSSLGPGASCWRQRGFTCTCRHPWEDVVIWASSAGCTGSRALPSPS